jgi:large subunit ribosomal protein L24
MALRIKKNDTVMVISGRDKGKKGRVLSVDQEKQRILVENCNLVKRHTRPMPQKNIKGGILEKESPLPQCKVKIFCGDCQKPTSIGSRLSDDGKKQRICKKCGATLTKGA